LQEDQHGSKYQHQGTEDDQGIANVGQLERAADANQEQHGGEEDGDPDVVVAYLSVMGARLGALVSLAVERVGRCLVRQLVLRI
jgi:hypothetical protein